MLRIIPFFLSILLVPSAIAQVKFIQSYGDELSDMARDVVALPNGYCVVGSSMNASNGEYDLFAMQTDLLGGVQWSNRFGEANCEHGFALDRILTGGFILAGSAIQEGRVDQDIMLVRVDANGNDQWIQYYGSEGTDEHARDVEQTNDGGFVVTGFVNGTNDGRNDIMLMKVDASGVVQWEQVYDMPNDQEALGLTETLNGFAITGRTYNDIQHDDLIYMLTDQAGNQQWVMTAGDVRQEKGRDIFHTSDNSLLICGYTNSYGMADFQDNINDHVWVVKTDMNGDTLFTTTVGDTLTHRRGFSITESNNGYVVCGDYREETSQTLKSYWLRLDLNGNVVWEHTYDDSEFDPLRAIAPTADGYIMTGWTFGPNSYDVLLIKTDLNGDPD